MNNPNSIYGRWASWRDKMIAHGESPEVIAEYETQFYMGAGSMINALAIAGSQGFGHMMVALANLTEELEKWVPAREDEDRKKDET